MSRGGRGGFGGGRGGAGMMGGHKLPFDIEPELEEIYKYGDNGETEEDPNLALFPPYPGGVPRAPPPTAREKELVKIQRELTAMYQASPNWTGPPGSARALCGKRTAADFNPFEDQKTYGKKYEPKPFRLPDPKKRKWQVPQWMPQELWEHIGYTPEAGLDESAPRKKLVLNTSSTLDRLARFDDNAPEGEAGGEEDGAEEVVDAEEGAEGEEVPRDDDFDEDDDDDANDYNAEQYFDDGEDDGEEGGGDEYGGGGDEGY
ncbi:hypothetical protein LTR62_000606 [Meristemomyces frigidus]|uniref:DNA-directed RNA polymerase III subunit n=1 Tax=Meristemomyces frigidus TaxID=1508187 RepID=A0AAN7TKB9_9PEZI|nr:hypothetical protein LTR62_000606 [Meristemomyces frigidus]